MALQAVSQRLYVSYILTVTLHGYASITGRACKRSGKRSEAGRKSCGAERSVERAWQKTMERERSAEREVAEREQSGKLAESAAHSPLQPDISFH